MSRRGKRYREALERVDREHQYTPRRALSLVKDTVTVNFNPTVDIAVRLGIDPRQADQMVRGAVALPHGTGKTVRVAVVTSGERLAEAEAAGADHIGGDDLAERLPELVDELDAVVASPDMMSKLGRLGKILGPRGLMPNPKSGTVTMDIGETVGQIKAGRIEYRSDRQGNVHAVLGRVSFTRSQLLDNYLAFIEELIRQRPASAKGRYLRSIVVSTTMGPGIKIDPVRSRDILEEDEEELAEAAPA